MGISDLATKLIGDKRRWKAYRARLGALPAPYRTAGDGIERYLLNTGPSDGDALMTMLDDLADLLEQSAADGILVREVFGDDPVEFAEAFKRNYGESGWMGKEQRRLAESIAQAEREQGS
ncbi:MAG: DUF1048 domain-containing protein [Microbacteriaceae bacterium]